MSRLFFKDSTGIRKCYIGLLSYKAESEGVRIMSNNKDIEDNLLKLYYQLIKTSSGGAELNLKNGDKLIVQIIRPRQHLNIINNTGGKDND